MINPLISIIIPTYNRARLIGETFDSIIAQTYTNWECIIVDDGSSDDTAQVIADYIKKDDRFHYYHRPIDRLKGANACRNYGYELSKGDYIKWFDSDDIMHTDFLFKQISVLEKCRELDFCASFSEMFDDKSDKRWPCNPKFTLDENAIYNFIIGNLFFLTPSTLWNRKFLEGKELFDETLYNAHETDFNFRRLIEGGKFLYFSDNLFYVRRGHQSIDKESVISPLSIQSQFDYFNKVFKFLNDSNCVLKVNEIKNLKKYVLYRLVVFFYQIRILMNFKKSINNFKSISKKIILADISLFEIFRLFSGIVLILFFKKGYRLIYIEKFDIRRLDSIANVNFNKKGLSKEESRKYLK
jgi:glycosyltransferase involved in cell wall biosynthesis